MEGKKKQREVSKMGDELWRRDEEIFIHRMELWKAVIEGRVLFCETLMPFCTFVEAWLGFVEASSLEFANLGRFGPTHQEKKA